MKPKFKPYNNLSKENWEDRTDHPKGQEWGYYPRTGLITNGRGEGGVVHRGTKIGEIHKIINALNKRDFALACFKKKG